MTLLSAEQRQYLYGLANTFYRPLVVLVLMIIGGGGWWFVVWPQIHSIQTSGLLTYDERVRLRDAKQQQLEQLQSLETEYTQLDGESLRVLELMLPRGLDKATVIASMEEFARQADVRLQALSISTNVDNANATLTPELPVNDIPQLGSLRTATIALTIEISGDQHNAYLGLKKLLKATESFIPLMDLRDLSFSSDQTTFTLQFQTPYLVSSSL